MAEWLASHTAYGGESWLSREKQMPQWTTEGSIHAHFKYAHHILIEIAYQ